ncbi:MAG: hypothetical protein HGA45_27170 [Chloroflexales bacterium]|nr:hypothetical protein [Chloroflexales bacterium]
MSTPTAGQSPLDEAGRLLIVLYGLFALSAGVRAAFQIATKWQRAPLAYGLSAVAALLYLLACAGIARRSPGAWRLATTICAFELCGVLLVGALTTLSPGALADATVWSGFGAGYGYVPLVLPALGLAWLLRPGTRRLYGA